MTDKERLGDFSSLPFEERIKLTKESIEKELKESDYYTPKNVCINTQYLLEIIEQAKRVQELKIKNKRYREALEFYANEETYETKFATDTDEIYDPLTLIELDEGRKARQTLEGEVGGRRMNIQIFKTHCLGCGKEVKSKIVDLTEDNEIIVDFIQDMEFECDCGTTTSVNVDFYENNY